RFQYKPWPSRTQGKRYRFHANQTLADESLLQWLRDMVGPNGHVHLVVPATPMDPASDRTDDKSLALATFRMRKAIEKLHELGVDAEGEVVVPDQIQAV